MITRTESWKCSDGTCFDLEKKEDAYNHEIKMLFQTLPKGDKVKQVTAFHLRKLADETKLWLAKARDFNETLKRAPRDRGLLVVKDYQQVYKEVTEWLESAQAVIDEISGETNVETKRAMAGQVG